MNLRITTTVDTGTSRLAIVGRLTRACICELEKACGVAQGSLVLDVSDLRFADAAGIAQLEQLAANGAQLERVNPYLDLLLQAAN